MSGAQPALKLSILIKELDEIRTKGDPSPFVLNRYEFEAQKLIDSQPSLAYLILGIVAFLRGNIEDMHRFHVNSIKLGASNEEIAFASYNYALNLLFANSLEESLKHAKEAYERLPFDAQVASLLAILYDKCGMFEESSRLEEEMERQPSFEDFVAKRLSNFDKEISDDPRLLEEPDQELMALVDSLTEDVEV